jgi:WD40 repeat protein
MAASPAGDVALGYPDGTLRFWGSASVSPSRPIHVSDRPLTAAAFSPDGRLLATSDLGGRAKLVDVRSEHVFGVKQLPYTAWAVAFSPDGQRIVWLDKQGLVYYFDPVIRTQIGPTQAFLADVDQLVWSPDSRNIVATRFPPPLGAKSENRAGGSVAVFNTNTNREQWSNSTLLEGRSDPNFESVAWSPDGTTIAAGGNAATGVVLLHASDGTQVGGGWKDHAVTSTIAYSPDGSTIASAGSDGTVVLRDVATGDRIGPPLVASYNQRPSLASFDAARHLIVATQDGGLWRWNIDLAHLLRQACAIAGRNLTTQEWADLHTAHPYLTACA